MVLFTLKLLNNLRKAIAGRRYPHQLAGGVALGVLLGIIPLGNLLALFVLLVVLCFRVNHAIAAIVAVATCFGAVHLDPYSHAVGQYVLSNPTGNQIATRAWALPLIPWTDLNNTVVLGSFLIGLLAVPPIFAITLPIFRLLAPAETEEESEGGRLQQAPSEAKQKATGISENKTNENARSTVKPTEKHSVSVVEPPQQEVLPPRFASLQRSSKAEDSVSSVSATEQPDQPKTIRIDSVLASQEQFVPQGTQGDSADPALPSNEEMVAVETRIDVIRIKDFQEEASDEANASSESNSQEPPMDEALSYLLRQLRQSQQRKAAG